MKKRNLFDEERGVEDEVGGRSIFTGGRKNLAGARRAGEGKGVRPSLGWQGWSVDCPAVELCLEPLRGGLEGWGFLGR